MTRALRKRAAPEQPADQARIISVWSAANQRAGTPTAPRHPGTGIASVLRALRDGSTHGRELARRCGQDYGNVSRWLLRLERMRLVHPPHEVPADEVVTEPRRIGWGRWPERTQRYGGGRPAKLWELTATGKELAELLATQ